METWTMRLVFKRYGTPAIYLGFAYLHTAQMPYEPVSGPNIPTHVMREFDALCRRRLRATAAWNLLAKEAEVSSLDDILEITRKIAKA